MRYRELAAIRRLLIIIASIAGCAQSAQALDLDKEVFTKQNVSRLCEADGTRSIVRRDRLANKLMQAGEMFDSLTQELTILRRAAPDGHLTDGDPTPENAIYFVSSPTPLGINHDYTREEQVVRARQLEVLTDFYQWLRGKHSINDNYTLVGGSEPPDPERYFQKDSPFQIVCKGGPAGGGGPPGGSGGGKSAPKTEATLKNVIVRKSVADIAVTGNDLKKANGAQFSYVDDIAKEKTTLSVEGLVGFVIAGTGADRAQELASRSTARDLYWYKVVPYIYYKNTTQNPSSKSTKDIEYVTPGVATDFTYVDRAGNFSFALQGEASATLDEQQNSNVYNFGLRFSPSFYDGEKVILGAPIGFGGIALRPDLALVAREYVIGDSGSNPDLQNLNTYSSVGYDAVLQIYLNNVDSVLSNFVGNAGYMYRYNTNGVTDIRRFTAGLSYIVSQNFTVDLTYVDGPDVNTFQDEHKWTAGLSFRN